MEKCYNNVLIALALIVSEMAFQLYISCFACHIFLFVTVTNSAAVAPSDHHQREPSPEY